MLDRLTIERMAAKAGNTPILIALSGGGDSVALMHLLVERFGGARLGASVVDHALREGSAQDAHRAAGFADALGVRAEVHTLAWPTGPRRAQQATREARYRALCDHAHALGARVIAVAHTADDQAETVLMRAAAGSTWRGLAGMAPLAPAPVWPEGRCIALARPLLNTRRAALREELRRRGTDWIEDPANTNDVFERVRVRARLKELEAEGFEAMRLVRVAGQLRERAENLDRAAADLIARAARFDEARIVIARAAWQGADEVRQRALSVLVTAAAGAQREPAAPALLRLEREAMAEEFRGASLGGAAMARGGAHIVLERDRGALIGRADGARPISPLPLTANVAAVWDGRVELTATEPGWSVVFENDAPCLANGEKRAALAAASPHWLLKARVGHALETD